MGKFPCHECGMTFPNMYKVKMHTLNGECEEGKKTEGQMDSDVQPIFTYDFSKAKAARSLDQHVWQNAGIAGGHHSAGGLGSTGVFLFVLKENQGVIVFKQGSSQIVAETFCAKLYRKLGIMCPDIRPMSKDEFVAFAETLKATPFTSEGAGRPLQEYRIQSMGGVLMEFGSGNTFKDLEAHRIVEDPSVHEEPLKQLGAIIACDMLSNSFDRTPMIWSHEGNANNILMNRSATGDIVVTAIDQSVSVIKNEEGREKYFEAVKGAIKEAMDKDVDGQYITKVRDFFCKFGNGTEIGASGKAAVQAGMLEQVKKIVAARGEFQKSWQETYEAFALVNKIGPQTDEGPDMVQFLEQVATAMDSQLSQS